MSGAKRQGVTVKGKRCDQRDQHERFVRDAIARSLLTLPFAYLDADDPFGAVYGYYKQLQDAATSGELPAAQVLMSLVALIRQDASVHESAGNYLKADVERRWCEGMWLHFTWSQDGSVTPVPVLGRTAEVVKKTDPANGVFDCDPYDGPMNKKGDW